MTPLKAVIVQQDDGAYELGAEIEGVFVPFSRLEAPNAEALIANARANAEREAKAGHGS